MRTQLLGAALAVTALTGFSGSAHAAVTVCQSAGCIQPNSNVLFDSNQVGNPITSGLNNSTATVTFTGNESLTTTSSGQARISGTDGDLTFLQFGLTNNQTFSEVEFNLNAATSGLATITFLGAGGLVLNTTTATLSANGQNFFDALGAPFTSVIINSTVQLTDVRQVRLGGIAAAVSAVPEPATWGLMLLGFGAVGASMRRRRRSSGPILQMA